MASQRVSLLLTVKQNETGGWLILLRPISPSASELPAGASLQLRDILPEDSRTYDKHKPPKTNNGPSIVYFHVTVLSIDSIDEESMVSNNVVQGLIHPNTELSFA